jgi:hypothetical protein
MGPCFRRDDGTGGHQAPFRDHGFAHLTGGLRAGDLADFHQHFLAGESLEFRGLGIAGGDELERFRPGFEVAQSARWRQPARLAGDLIGRNALAVVAGADAHDHELARQHVAGIDRPAGLRRRSGLLGGRCGRRERRRHDGGKSRAFGESSFRHVADVR